MPVLVHKLPVELKGKSQDSVPVFVLYIKNAKALQMESMQNVSRSGEKGGLTTRACRHSPFTGQLVKGDFLCAIPM
ncbi:hypothetical protein, partial [Allisonella histaminiformans]|uniref:hypothetical protein n=1 Tax=Allisonella histaminiformans TaxID=209880 RepID=UPI0022E90E0C